MIRMFCCATHDVSTNTGQFSAVGAAVYLGAEVAPSDLGARARADPGANERAATPACTALSNALFCPAVEAVAAAAAAAAAVAAAALAACSGGSPDAHATDARQACMHHHINFSFSCAHVGSWPKMGPGVGSWPKMGPGLGPGQRTRPPTIL